MRNILKLGFFLFLVAGLAGLGISYVNGITAPIIEEQMLQTKVSSFKDVYPQGQEIKDESAKYLQGASAIVQEVNVVYEAEAPIGVIFTVEPVGYGGKIKALVGFDIASQKVTGIKVLSQTETPGLGANIAKSSFVDRFKGKRSDKPLEVVKTDPVSDHQVLAITAATISSKGVTSGVNAAREVFMKHFSK